MSQRSKSRRAERRHKAGALDIRNVIGLLIATYGVILVLMGLFGDPATEKTGGVNANLWSGLAMLAAGLGFLLWAWLRPLLVSGAGAPDAGDPAAPAADAGATAPDERA
ncbi:hypothetical protein GHK92_16505 [Nocardioides sp. dk4132]|uniref:hypothetical protein n=1 Tax=unclassified Nocardioides TaxID=2615069 RepID=UPI001294B412|nr:MULTISPECIES: hypothetical protein [unclassified Nocardioides]MQW77476.1 hypothetical protein [Nocardioides sp. dk4132]QGA09277.1 hypothetical protein GFH29_19190 [Nocardioides sp. dk884]